MEVKSHLVSLVYRAKESPPHFTASCKFILLAELLGDQEYCNYCRNYVVCDGVDSPLLSHYFGKPSYINNVIHIPPEYNSLGVTNDVIGVPYNSTVYVPFWRTSCPSKWVKQWFVTLLFHDMKDLLISFFFKMKKKWMNENRQEAYIFTDDYCIYLIECG